MAFKGKTFGYKDPPNATVKERDQFRQDRKRALRAADGLCPYCGRHPEPGRVRCARCNALGLARNARRAARLREARAAAARAAQPRRCSRCNGSDLAPKGSSGRRPRYRCRTCGCCSVGDGPPPPPPDFPCPYCRGRCTKQGTMTVAHNRRPQRFRCTVCGRTNTLLWPEDTPSPGGPFPHYFKIYLNLAAHRALLAYCQNNLMSVAQAVRDIFIRAGQAPLARISRARSAYGIDGRVSAVSVHSTVIPNPPLPPVPPGGYRFPDERPAALAKLCRARVGNRLCPTVLVTLSITVQLNDDALAGLVDAMRRRGLGRQDTARALIAETYRPFPPVISVSRRDDLDNDGW